MGIKFLQTNLGRSRAAHDLAYATCKRMGVDVLVVGEPNKKLVGSPPWIRDRRSDVAVLFVNRGIEAASLASRNGHLCISLSGLRLICCYMSPNIGMNEYEAMVGDILGTLRGSSTGALIMGDLNARSPLWGSPTADRKGEAWADAIAANDLVVQNHGGSPTFVRGGSVSYIDVTLSTRLGGMHVKNWSVMPDEGLTLHRYIYFEVDGAVQRVTGVGGTKVGDLDKGKMSRIMGSQLSGVDSVESLTAALAAAQRASSCGGRRRGPQPYWWGHEIAQKREQCNGARRNLTRMRARRIIDEGIVRGLEEVLKGYQRELKRLINKSKRERWKELCERLDGDIWGDGYRIAMKHLRCPMSPCALEAAAKMSIVKVLFPMSRNQPLEGDQIIDLPPPFTEAELAEAAGKIKVGKAAGLDGIAPLTVKVAVEEGKAVLLNIFNRLMEEGSFPAKWKEAGIVLIPKGKPELALDDPAAYRPICLIDVVGKLFEQLIKGRLEAELEAGDALSDRQFGFRKGRSTIQAVEAVLECARRSSGKWCVLVTLDIRNAFNTASWRGIKVRLREIGVSGGLIRILDNYLCERCVILREGGRHNLNGGVPQGSVLGPTLWNVLYDPVLRLELPAGCQTFAFADDLALLVEADDRMTLATRVEYAVDTIKAWMRDAELGLATHKTEALVIKGPRNRENIVFDLDPGGTKITPSKSLKYLGIHLDSQGNFSKHVREATAKADRVTAALTRVMPNIGGPGTQKRLALCGVVQSTLLYGAPVWAPAMRMDKYRGMVVSSQRRVLLRAACAYRTVSAEALQVILARVPIDLLVDERSRIYRSRNGHREEDRRLARNETMIEWQARWDALTEKAQWTKLLFPNVRGWVCCGHRVTDYALTQFFTGHGSFRTYTKRIGKSGDDLCIYCGEVDTVEHTFFECRRWVEDRTSLHISWGETVNLGNVMSMAIEDQNKFNTFRAFANNLIKKKEEEEREWQSRENR